MTVAVSTASAIQQIQSILPAAFDYRIEIAFVSISLITIGNLRGLRESGNIFAVPTYLFVGLALLIVIGGVFRIVSGTAHALPPQPDAVPLGATEQLSIFLLLKAFAGGSVALTGVEAIANGVPAFKKPEAKNAANTMITMAILLGIIFIGITVVAHAFAIVPSVDNSGGPTVVALVAGTVFGASPLFYLFQIATALILFLAANTSFNAFPRLAAILAEDGYMPRQFSFRGDRLAYSWGIVLLAGIAFGLLVLFNGDTHALIPLYSVGVFVCFTLSQSGMVKHWFTTRETGWWWRAIVNAFGCVLTFVVLIIVTSVKFQNGAYLVIILIPLLVAMMLFIQRQYGASPAPARDPARLRGQAAAPRGAGGHPDPGPDPGGHPGRQRRPLDQRGRAGRATSPRIPRPRSRSASSGSGRSRACRWSSSSRPIGRSSGRSWPTSTCSTTPGRRTSPSRSPSWSCPSTSLGTGGSGSSTTSRLEAAAGGPRRAAAHRSRQRPLPARGGGRFDAAPGDRTTTGQRLIRPARRRVRERAAVVS